MSLGSVYANEAQTSCGLNNTLMVGRLFNGVPLNYRIGTMLYVLASDHPNQWTT